MMRTTYRFDEVKMYGYKTGKCGCGKQRHRQRKFWATINPFNKNDDGTMKTTADIRKDLKKQIDEWKKEPITCEVCHG